MLVRAGYFFVADARARLEIVRLELNYWARSVVASLHGRRCRLWGRPGGGRPLRGEPKVRFLLDVWDWVCVWSRSGWDGNVRSVVSEK